MALITSRELYEKKDKKETEDKKTCYSLLEKYNKQFTLEGGAIKIEEAILYEYREYVVKECQKAGWAITIKATWNRNESALVQNGSYTLEYTPYQKLATRDCIKKSSL